MPGWGGAPEGWLPPEERRMFVAAAKAAAAMEESRAQADSRASALADAIRDGFGMLASAILAASDHPASFALKRYQEVIVGNSAGLDEVYTGPLEDTTAAFHEGFDRRAAESAKAADDPDMADLVSDTPVTLCLARMFGRFGPSSTSGCSLPAGHGGLHEDHQTGAVFDDSGIEKFTSE